MNPTKVDELKVCLKSIIICSIPNAIPISRIYLLVEYILGENATAELKRFSVQKFVETYMPNEIALLGDGKDTALIHPKCKDGDT